MKKKILSVALVLLMCLSLFPTVVSAKETTYLKDMLDTFSGTYVFRNDVTYGDTFQTGTATLTLNENELSFEILMIFYHLQGEKKTVDCNIATKFKFDENGYNDWKTTTFVEGKPQYGDGALISDYKIGNLLEDTEVEYLDKENRYKISVFDMMDFFFYDVQDGKAQKAEYNETVFERDENDETAIPTPFIGQAATPTRITATTTEWSGWMLAADDVEINGDVTVKGNTYLVLANGVTLKVNGTVNANNGFLNVYAQKDTGNLIVKGGYSKTAVLGGIIINGGNVSFMGGDNGGYGIDKCNINITDGKVSITGGNGTDSAKTTSAVKGTSAVNNSQLTVSGNAEVTIKGGNGGNGNGLDLYGKSGGSGMSGSVVKVTGGVVTATGGETGDFEESTGTSDNRKACAFDGLVEMIDAEIQVSQDGVNFSSFDRKHPVNSIDYYHSVKLTSETNQAVPETVKYLDEQGTEWTLDIKPTEITKDTTELTGWMIVYGNVTIDRSVVSASNAKLILADGASLTLKGSLYSISDIPLNIYAQELGTGKLTIKVSDSYTGVIVTNGINGNVIVNGGTVSINGAKEGGNGIDGSITVNGGTVSINGGENGGENGGNGINGNITVNGGTACVTGGTVGTITGKVLSGVGILRGTVTVNGGTLTVAGGKNGGTGIRHSTITVNGGELNVEGGYGDIYGGNGIEACDISFTGGFAVVNGGKAKRLSLYGKACIDDCEFHNAEVLGSKDGESYEPFNAENKNLYRFLKFSPKVDDEQEEQPGTVIPEQQTPDKRSDSQKKADNEIVSPDTGDTSNPILWIVLFAVSLSVIVFCLTYDKKRKAVK